MAFLTLKEAADYARFACAAYAVFEYEDPEEKDGEGNAIMGHCAATCGMCKPKGNTKTYATVIRCALRRQISKRQSTIAHSHAESHRTATCGVCKPRATWRPAPSSSGLRLSITCGWSACRHMCASRTLRAIKSSQDPWLELAPLPVECVR